MAAVSICSDFGAQKIKSDTVSTVSPSISVWLSNFTPGTISKENHNSKRCMYPNISNISSIRRNGVALIVNKSPKCSTWVQSQNWQDGLRSFPRQTIQHHSNLSLCPNHWCPRGWSWTVLWRPIRVSRTPEKRCPFHHRGLEWKSQKSTNTWSNR